MNKHKILITAGILAVSLLAGCANEQKSENSSVTSASFGSSAEKSTESSSESGASSDIPKGEPTVFTAPDGKPIYTSEITAIEGTEKTADNLAKTDYGTTVICEGFQYFTEPSGVAYNNYQNADMFDDYAFSGNIAENKNSSKRVNVGDEICGLKLTRAVSEFKIDDYADTPEPYYYDGLSASSVSDRVSAEFDGTITIEGFLGIGARSSYDPDGGLLGFMPTESKLPILGSKPEFYERTSFVSSEIVAYSDMPGVQCGYFRDMKCDSAGLGIGDVALVRLTLNNIRYRNSQTVDAEIEKIELISDVLYHAEDTI